jgi:hypothetical protein
MGRLQLTSSESEMRGLVGISVLALALSGRLEAQGESELKQFFEGKMVVARLELPATEEGVDIRPDQRVPLDYAKYATRLKRAGTAIRAGDRVMVTKVKVKKKHIEFQLGGGGYGTFGDDVGGDVWVPTAEKTEREKRLEREIERESSHAVKRKLREERDQLRKDREREDVSNRAAVAAASEARKANARARAVEGGSRFNLRYESPVGAGQLTAQSVMRALGRYLEFPTEEFAQRAQGDSPSGKGR